MNLYLPAFALLAAATVAQASSHREVAIDLLEGPRAAFVRCAVAASFPEPIIATECGELEGDWTYCRVAGGAHPAVMSAKWTSANNATLVLKADDLKPLKWGKVFTTTAADGEVEVYDQTWSCNVRMTPDHRVVVDVREKSK